MTHVSRFFRAYEVLRRFAAIVRIHRDRQLLLLLLLLVTRNTLLGLNSQKLGREVKLYIRRVGTAASTMAYGCTHGFCCRSVPIVLVFVQVGFRQGVVPELLITNKRAFRNFAAANAALTATVLVRS